MYKYQGLFYDNYIQVKCKYTWDKDQTKFMIMKRKLKEVTIKKTPWPLFSHFSSPFLETLEQKNNIRIGNYPCINACLPNLRRSKSFFFLFFLVQKNVTILCSFMILQYFCKWFSVYYLNFSYLQVVGITYYQLICVSKFEQVFWFLNTLPDGLKCCLHQNITYRFRMT